MIKLFSIIILFCSLICANTIQDTLSDTTTNHYDTEIVSLMGSSNLTLMIDVTDASVAGFGSDSIDVLYGFQIGHLTLDTLGQPDTAWTERIICDTITSGTNIGTESETSLRVLDDNFLISYIDTSSVNGYAVQRVSYNLTPLSGTHFIRGFIRAATSAQKQGAPIFFRFRYFVK